MKLKNLLVGSLIALAVITFLYFSQKKQARWEEYRQTFAPLQFENVYWVLGFCPIYDKNDMEVGKIESGVPIIINNIDIHEKGDKIYLNFLWENCYVIKEYLSNCPTDSSFYLKNQVNEFKTLREGVGYCLRTDKENIIQKMISYIVSNKLAKPEDIPRMTPKQISEVLKQVYLLNVNRKRDVKK